MSKQVKQQEALQRLRSLTEKDDMELVGLFDLLLAQPKQNTYLDFIEEFLRTTHRYELYRYLVSIIVAGQRSEVWKMLLEVARRERDQSKVEILLSALAFIENDPLVADVIRDIRP